MATINGNENNNNLNGTNADDDIYGLGGDDTISGNGGNDTINGDVPEIVAGKVVTPGKIGKAGDDLIDGGAGNDLIFGDGGDDVIEGGSGADTLYGDFDPALSGVNKIGKILGNTAAGDDIFRFDDIGDGYGDVIFGGDGSGPDGKVGKGTDNDTLDLTNTTLGGSGITATVATTADSDGNGFDGTVTWRDNDGNIVGTLTFENIENIVNNSAPCFASGTLIVTPVGEKRIEDLSVGDEVFTADSGAQTIRWIDSTTVDAARLSENPDLKPIRISAGALGKNVPEQDLVLSPQHRVLLESRIVERVCGAEEVLVPVKKLLDLDGVCVVDDGLPVTYYHMLLDRHEIVFANGARTESLYLGYEGLKAMSPEARLEICNLFPILADPDFEPVSARPIHQRTGKIKNMVDRHAKNGVPLQKPDLAGLQRSKVAESVGAPGPTH